MIKNNQYPATMIVFEGLDCSFKSTNAKRAYEYLKETRKNKNVLFFKYPDYKEESSYFVREYLDKKYDEVFKENAGLMDKWRTIATFYALDRFDSFRLHNIWDLLKDPNNILVFDRYCTSNLFYQIAWLQKIKGFKNITEIEYKRLYDEEVGFIRYFEQTILGLPMEDLTIVLEAPLDKILEVLDNKQDKDGIESDRNLIINSNNNVDDIIECITTRHDKWEVNPYGLVCKSQHKDTVKVIHTVDDNNEFLSEDVLFDKVKHTLELALS